MSSVHGQVPSLLENHLSQITPWPSTHRAAYADLAARLVLRVTVGGIRALGISGAPGTGKSTLANLLALGLRALGIRALVVSLDDFYLGRAQREQLTSVHPLLAQRGVPGTHDWGRLMNLLDRVATGDVAGIRIPRFDKSIDDVVDDTQFVMLEHCPDIVILEGWAIGVPEQEEEQLQTPVNDLEEKSDTDGRWRRWVNAQLKTYHRDIRKRLDEVWFLAAPDWASVLEWRSEQEAETARRSGKTHLDSPDAIAQFLDRFQRIAVHMLDTCGSWADLVIRIDRNHQMILD